MPGKSRRRRGKSSVPSRKKRAMSNRPSLLVPPSVGAQAAKAVSSPNLPVPKAGVPVSRVEPAPVHYPYVAAEMRTIGILAGIMVIVLVVLALLIS